MGGELSASINDINMSYREDSPIEEEIKEIHLERGCTLLPLVSKS